MPTNTTIPAARFFMTILRIVVVWRPALLISTAA
jgi:hypothetical protein